MNAKLSTARRSLAFSPGHEDADAVARIKYSFPPTTVIDTSSTAAPNRPAVPPPTFVSMSYVSASPPPLASGVFRFRLPIFCCRGAESARLHASASRLP